MADEMQQDEMQQDEMQELIRDFVIETDEVLEGLDQCFVKLEESPGDLGLINEILRAVHSIKGSAGFLGFTRLVEVAHQSENVLNKLRQQEIQATSETIDIILESVDVLKALMSEIKDNTGAQIDINTIKRKLSLLLEYSALLETSSDESEKPGETSLCHPELVSVSQMKPNKEINLEMHGEATEIDKSVIEELNDPLVHIIRNSIDHGIETPEDRMKKGKPEAGTI